MGLTWLSWWIASMGVNGYPKILRRSVFDSVYVDFYSGDYLRILKESLMDIRT